MALRRAWLGIWTVGLAYVLSVGAGIWTVHQGWRPALDFRDRLVGTAQRESASLRALDEGARWKAAAIDAAGNAAVGLAGGIAGYCPPAGYALVLQRGWVGGVVSVDDRHRTRLDSAYYLVTLLLQLIPSTLAAGAGVNLGLAAFRPAHRTGYDGPRVRWLRIPHAALRDAALIYAATLPLYALASLYEFLMAG